MLEILFIFGVLGWLLGVTWEYLSALPAFPTLLAAMGAVPLLCWTDYLATRQKYELDRLDLDGEPVPPERFYWNLRKRRVLATIWLLIPAMVVSWMLAMEFPADSTFSVTSITGWLSGAAAILATARFIAWSVIYVRASQWFDEMAPWAVGLCRRALYRFSENPDFLGEANDSKKQAEKEKSLR
jgi:hypothetical protein